MSGKGRHSGGELRGGSGNGGREEKRTLLLVGLSMRTIEADDHQDQIDGAGMNQRLGPGHTSPPGFLQKWCTMAPSR